MKIKVPGRSDEMNTGSELKGNLQKANSKSC